jgi:hypothetical protein
MMRTRRPPIHFFSALVGVFALVASVTVRADPVINEFMASNTSTLADEDGAFSDWIEIYNPDAIAVNLGGWYLSNDTRDKKEWAFPTVVLPAHGYLVVFASSKDRRDPAKNLHTNFKLNADGEYLALIKPNGTTAATEFSPAYPAQKDNISYGSALVAAGSPSLVTYLQTPTPAPPAPAPTTTPTSREAGPTPAAPAGRKQKRKVGA